MIIALKVLHILLCLFLIVVVLLQHGKGQDIGAAFGGASQTVFGPGGGGSFFGKLTAIVAVLFMVTSVSLGYFGGRGPVKTLVPESSAPTDEAPTAGGTDQPSQAPAAEASPPAMPALPGSPDSEAQEPATPSAAEESHAASSQTGDPVDSGEAAQ